jgi:hypothetical protein
MRWGESGAKIIFNALAALSVSQIFKELPFSILTESPFAEDASNAFLGVCEVASKNIAKKRNLMFKIWRKRDPSVHLMCNIIYSFL